MLRIRHHIAPALLVGVSLLVGCAERNPGPPPGVDPGAPLVVSDKGEASVFGREAPLAEVKRLDTGFMLPDGQGGVVWSQGKPRPGQDSAFMEARELKLKVRELCDQLLSTMPNDGLMGFVALPASFVDQEDFDRSSPFGRFLSESLFYEFNQRGFPVRDYRMPGTLRTREGEGEFVLSRQLGTLPGREAWAVFVTGTYYRDKYAVFLNARLIRASDGLVLRTAQLVLPANELVARMLPRTATSRGITGGTLGIRSETPAAVSTSGGRKVYPRNAKK